MLQLGAFQTLTVIKKVEFGVYLAEEAGSEDRVLLPKKQVPQGTRLGDSIRVFLYRDSDDRLIATCEEPKLVMGEYALLRVKEVSRIGAFLDWGLEKDLFLPYKEMGAKVQADDEILVRLYIDKSGRLCASMKHLYEMLSCDSPYKTGDDVTGRIYEFGHDFGTFVAVDDKYSAMIPSFEDVSQFRLGQVVRARVTNVKEDGKLDLSIREKSYLQMDVDAAKLMELLESYGGVLPFTEKASPEVIKRETGMTKNAFKRAVGRLYKERHITLEGGKIRLNTSQS